MKNVIILGGGYGGLTVIKHLLEEEIPRETILTLVDKIPYQGLKTEYYALAAGTVSEYDIRVPFPIDPRLIIKYGDVKEIDLEHKQVVFETDERAVYDTLVIALGCTDRYHGIPGADSYTYGLQSLSATRKTYGKINAVPPFGQVTIVGGGLSGVEFASELRESRPDLNIRILDRGPSILSPFPEKLRLYVREWFEEHEIEMRNHISLSRVEPTKLYHNGQATIDTDAVVWTAGIQPSSVVQRMDLPKDAIGRVIINEYHQIDAYPDVYVVGDCAALPFSPNGQAAEAQGKQVAQVIQAGWRGHTPRLTNIKLKGVLGALGKRAGFGVMGSRTVLIGRVPRVLKSGVLWMSKHHLG
jgi:NADH dehydrogenase